MLSSFGSEHSWKIHNHLFRRSSRGEQSRRSDWLFPSDRSTREMIMDFSLLLIAHGLFAAEIDGVIVHNGTYNFIVIFVLLDFRYWCRFHRFYSSLRFWGGFIHNSRGYRWFVALQKFFFYSPTEEVPIFTIVFRHCLRLTPLYALIST